MGVLFAALGLTVARRSVGETPTAATDVYLADTLGELGILYRACDLVMMGKSFTVGGGQNPAEPAKLGCAVVCGPDMSNFRELTAAMTVNGAMVQVADAGQLTAEVGRLLRDPAARQTLGQNGAQFIAAESQALAATLAILEPHLINREPAPNTVDCP
jgi:3-deoxy-D-manno-octulosonic-acid transferase